MKRLLAISLVFLALAGCADSQYTLDMSGLDQVSQDNLHPVADRYTMTELDHLSQRTLGETSDRYSMSTLNDLSSETFDKYTRK